MIKLFLSSTLLFASPCFAKVVLSCSLTGADVISVEVKESGGRLELREVLVESRKDASGNLSNTNQREIPAQEWASKIIALSVLSASAKSTLTFDKNADRWWLDHDDGAFNNHGFMPCN